ncbi:MAG: hypothetical protein IJZ71_08170 [Treponema sp.]|nr:hypothetical protein [Treponema sp.]
MNDETILIKYYKDVFESKEYKRICSINWQENEQNSKIRKARIRMVLYIIIIAISIFLIKENYWCLGTLVAYISMCVDAFKSRILIPSIFNRHILSYVFQKSNLLPYLAILTTLIFSIIVIVAIKKQYKRKKELEDIKKSFYDASNAFNELFQNVDKPNLPINILESPQLIKNLLLVFESKRSETFKEALIIYEQDRQHEELMRRQRQLESMVYSAQAAAEKARKEAQDARNEAQRARIDADYNFWNNNY